MTDYIIAVLPNIQMLFNAVAFIAFVWGIIVFVEFTDKWKGGILWLIAIILLCLSALIPPQSYFSSFSETNFLVEEE